MENGKKEPLFNQFAIPAEEEWLTIAKKEIGKLDLSWSSYENIRLKPIYSKKDLETIIDKQAYQHNKFINSQGWQLIENVRFTSENDTNKRAINALEGGADGIEFSLDDKNVNIEELLKGIWIDNCILGFEISEHSLPTITHFFSYYDKENKLKSDLRGWINFDPIKNFLTNGAEISRFPEVIKHLFKLSFDYPNFKSLTINSHHIVNAGGNIIEEISYVLATLVEYLEAIKDNELSLKEAFVKILFSLTVTTNFFFEISKLRAIRILLCKLAQAYNIELLPSDIQIHSKTSVWCKSNLDSHNNIIRNSAEGMAAILGNTDYLTISDFTPAYSEEKNLTSRASRNISHVLKEEAYLAKVVDPSAGSYYIEVLTDLIQKEVWEEFLKIEEQGGMIEAIKKGWFTSKVVDTRRMKLNNLDLRKDLLIGSNIYPNLKETVLQEELTNVPRGLITEQNAASGIEELKFLVGDEFGKDLEKVLIFNLTDAELSKASVALVKHALTSIGFSVELSKNKGINQDDLAKTDFLIVFIADNKLDESLSSLLSNNKSTKNIILTSEKEINLSDLYSTSYKQLDKLVLHENLKEVLFRNLKDKK